MSIPTNEKIEDLAGNGDSTNEVENGGFLRTATNLFKFLISPDLTRTFGEDIFKHHIELNTNPSESDLLLMEVGDIYKLIMQNLMLADELKQLKYTNQILESELKDLQETHILTSFESPDIKKRIEEMDLEDES